jgi:hypothetical protein
VIQDVLGWPKSKISSIFIDYTMVFDLSNRAIIRRKLSCGQAEKHIIMNIIQLTMSIKGQTRHITLNRAKKTGTSRPSHKPSVI